MWPELLVTLNDIRSRRMDYTVYGPRRNLLKSEYEVYVALQALTIPALDLLPDVMELSYFPLFRDIIKAPEGTEVGASSFDHAFAQLPALVEEWRKQLDDQLAELVKIPCHLSSKDASRGRGRASSSATHTEPSLRSADKLRLASAVFKKDDIAAPYPDILFLAFPELNPTCHEGNLEGTVSIRGRFGIEFLEEVPYIVHACGLDPNVATAEDLDRRNARLKCLTCSDPWIPVMDWRSAVGLH